MRDFNSTRNRPAGSFYTRAPAVWRVHSGVSARAVTRADAGDDEPLAIVAGGAALKDALLTGLPRAIGVLAVDAVEAIIATIEKRRICLVLIDIRAGAPGSIELARTIKSTFPDVPVILTTDRPDFELAVAALRLGVDDLFTDPLDLERVVTRSVELLASAERRRAAAEALVAAQTLLSPRAANVARPRPVSAPPPPAAPAVAEPTQLSDAFTRQLASLSPREREVMDAFVHNPSVGDVARRYDISVHTVRGHLRNIYRKLDVTSQAELIAVAHTRRHAS